MPDHAADVVARAVRLADALGEVQHPLRLLGDLGAEARQRRAVGVAIEQAAADRGLELLHAQRQRRLRERQPRGGGAHAAEAGDPEQRLELRERQLQGEAGATAGWRARPDDGPKPTHSRRAR